MLNVRRTSLLTVVSQSRRGSLALMEDARHYAVALGAGAFKPRTVGDLVRAIAVAAPRAARASTAGGRDSSTGGTSTRRDVPVAIACAARDGVDEVAVACAEFGVIRTLHADQDADERRGVLAACARSARRGAFDDDDDDDDEGPVNDDDARCVCVVTTDACLPSAANGEASLGFPLLVNYDVPRTKEAYARRARVALGGGGRGGGGGVVVTLIVADDETSSLREVCGDREVETMPVDVLEEVARGWFRRANGPDA